eukprot:3056120-Pyramimonas_sp.AAC.1
MGAEKVPELRAVRKAPIRPLYHRRLQLSSHIIAGTAYPCRALCGVNNKYELVPQAWVEGLPLLLEVVHVARSCNFVWYVKHVNVHYARCARSPSHA